MPITDPWLSAGPLATALFWSVATIAFYACSRLLYRRWPQWWTSPVVLTPVLLLLLALDLHAGYRDYIGGTHWLTAMLGPITVAFALPIYEQRALIRRYWPILLVGVLVGSSLAMFSAWGLASALGLSGAMRLSLLPRSVSVPFAVVVSSDIGGIPDLTAVFVVLTGVFGGAAGEAILKWAPLRSNIARGALLGMAAHGVGVATAHRVGREEGSIAGLVMVLAGLFNVLAAPVLAACLR
jgi:predicted murein hydrolase (TIGR00659 family)